MSMTDTSARREQVVFCVAEATFATLVVPTAAAGLYVLDAVGHEFDPEVIEDAQIRDGMSYTAPFQGQNLPGKWRLSCYNKPSGVATTAPEAKLLIECAMGSTGASASGNRYRFPLGTTFQSFSMFRKQGHTVYQLAGCIVQEMVLNMNGNEIASIEFSGEFAKRHFAGYATAATGIAGGITGIALGAGEWKYFSVGSYVQLGSDTCTGAGYKVTGFNTGTNMLNFTPASIAGCTAGGVVRGYAPATCTEVGSPVHGKLGNVLLDGSQFKSLTNKITVATGLKMYTGEKNNSLVIDEFGAPVKRTVSFEMTAYHYKTNAKLHSGVDYATQYAMVVPAGQTAPNIVTALIPKFVVKSDPVPAGAEEQVMTIRGQAYASASLNDELVLVYGTTGDA